jgi:hypothetical protein
MAWDTAANIVNDAAVELGLWAADVADPFSAPDALSVQLTRLLRSLGQRLVQVHPWSHLVKAHAFSSEVGTGDYPLPADFARPLDQTYWQGSRELEGPIGPRAWSGRSATLGGIWRGFRLLGGRLHLHPTPAAVESVSFEYVSTYWVQPAGQTEPTSATPTAGTDVLHFDRQLLIAGLKLTYLSSTGFDTSGVAREYAEAFGAAVAADSPAPALSLNGPRGPHLLDWRNVPEGSW